MKVSTLILTFNEASNLPRCIEALKWCDDIVVLDSNSTDNTQAIARKLGANVIEHPFDNFANQRNHGLETVNFKHDWVLHLDADEVITPEFVQKLKNLHPNTGIQGYRIPSKTMLHGRWLKHAGMYPTYQIRLGHKNHLRFVQVGHGQRGDLKPDEVGTFNEPYLHYNFSHGLFRWLHKHTIYARDEAKYLLSVRQSDINSANPNGNSTQRRRRLKSMTSYLPVIFRPPLRLFYVFIWRKGFLDGKAGFTYAFMMSVYEAMIALFVWDERHKAKLNGKEKP